MPEYTPSGVKFDALLNDLEDTLIRNFIGFHSVYCESVYAHGFNNGEKDLQSDAALLYTVPIQNTAKDLQKLLSIVKLYAAKMKQTHLYFEKPNGEVTFLDIEPEDEDDIDDADDAGFEFDSEG